jgi:hypothetical protein
LTSGLLLLLFPLWSLERHKVDRFIVATQVEW